MPSDFDVICAMARYGGSFEQALAAACRCADHENLRRIKTAFPEYWEQYSDSAFHRQ